MSIIYFFGHAKLWNHPEPGRTDKSRAESAMKAVFLKNTYNGAKILQGAI